MWSPVIDALRPPRPVLVSATGCLDLGSGQVFADFAGWCAAHRGQRCVLWLAGDRLHELVPEAGLPLDGAAARLAWARRVLVHYHGAAADQWPLAAWRGGMGVSVLQGVDLGEWRRTAAAQRVRVLALRPLWPLLLQRLLQQRPALRQAAAGLALLVHEAVVIVLTLRHGRVQAVALRRLGSDAAPALQSLVDEERLGAEPGRAPEVAAVLWLGGQAPAVVGLDVVVLEEGVAALVKRPWRRPVADADFAAPLPRPGALAWSLCAGALGVLALAAAEAHGAWQARAAAQALVLPARPASAAVQPPAPDPRGSDASRRLAYAWPELLLAGEEAAAPGVRFTGFEHRFGGELRLRGLAADAAQVQRAAAALRRSPRLQAVNVASVEAVPGGQAFELVARAAVSEAGSRR